MPIDDICVIKGAERSIFCMAILLLSNCLNSFGNALLQFLQNVCWNIVPCILKDFPHLFMWLWMFFVFFRSKWSQIASMIFKSGLCGGHSISSRTPWSSFLFKYLLTLFAVCLGSLSCWKVKRGSINHLPDGMAWCIKICLYFSAFIIPSSPTKSPTPPAEIQPQIFIDPPPCFSVGCKQGSCTSSPLLLRTYWRRLLPKTRTLTRHFTAPSSVGQNSSCCVPAHTSSVWSSFLFLKEAFLLQL